MDATAWIILVVAVAAVFLLISGEVVVTVVLAGAWIGVVWLLVTYGGFMMRDGIGPAIVIVVGMVILSIVTLAAMASVLEDRRSDKG
jgi:hypothetical protein